MGVWWDESMEVFGIVTVQRFTMGGNKVFATNLFGVGFLLGCFLPGI